MAKKTKKLCGAVLGILCAFSLLALCGCGLRGVASHLVSHDSIEGTWALVIEDGSLSHDYECTFQSDGKWSCDWLVGKYGEGSGSWQNETESYLDHKNMNHEELIAQMSEQNGIELADVQVYVMDANSDVESYTLLLEDEEGNQVLKLGSSDGSFLLLGKS